MTDRVVLVTGAAGGLGERVLPELRRRDWRVRCLVHERPIEGADEHAPGDLAAGDGLRRAVSGTDAVLHLAAVTHARRRARYERVNAVGTRRLVDACRDGAVRRLVHVSTRALGESGGAYSESKRRAEAAVSESGLEHVIVRVPEIYGTGSGEGIERVLASARSGRPILIVGDGHHELCPVHVDDAAVALAAALDAPAAAGRVYSLGGESITAGGFAEACVAELRSRSRIVRVPEWLVAAASLPARVLPLPLYPDQLARLRARRSPESSDARTDLGYAPRPFRQALRAQG